TMKSIIEELWRGNIDPQNERALNTAEMRQLVEYIARHHEDLLKTMSDEQKEIFEKLGNCQREYAGFAEEAIFAYAFRLGARIIAEALLPPIDKDCE
ncbi:MAG: hypothetical protein IJW79_03620, partial [Clostridia bacterium]|nr:hypothetical protein [Clostridia bacterium]